MSTWLGDTNDAPKRSDGGPAFPTNGTSHRPPEGGMSLRDWFAGQVLAGILAVPDIHTTDQKIAKVAYVLADAMLAERAK